MVSEGMFVLDDRKTPFTMTRLSFNIYVKMLQKLIQNNDLTNVIYTKMVKPADKIVFNQATCGIESLLCLFLHKTSTGKLRLDLQMGPVYDPLTVVKNFFEITVQEDSYPVYVKYEYYQGEITFIVFKSADDSSLGAQYSQTLYVTGEDSSSGTCNIAQSNVVGLGFLEYWTSLAVMNQNGVQCFIHHSDVGHKASFNHFVYHQIFTEKVPLNRTYMLFGQRNMRNYIWYDQGYYAMGWNGVFIRVQESEKHLMMSLGSTNVTTTSYTYFIIIYNTIDLIKADLDSIPWVLEFGYYSGCSSNGPGNQYYYTFTSSNSVNQRYFYLASLHFVKYPAAQSHEQNSYICGFTTNTYGPVYTVTYNQFKSLIMRVFPKRGRIYFYGESGFYWHMVRYIFVEISASLDSSDPFLTKTRYFGECPGTLCYIPDLLVSFRTTSSSSPVYRSSGHPTTECFRNSQDTIRIYYQKYPESFFYRVILKDKYTNYIYDQLHPSWLSYITNSYYTLQKTTSIYSYNSYQLVNHRASIYGTSGSTQSSYWYTDYLYDEQIYLRMSESGEYNQLDITKRPTNSLDRMFTTSNDVAYINQKFKSLGLSPTFTQNTHQYSGAAFAADYKICSASGQVCVSLKSNGLVANLAQAPGSPTNTTWDVLIYASVNSASWQLLQDGRIQITDSSGSITTLGSSYTVSDTTSTYMYLQDDLVLLTVYNDINTNYKLNFSSTIGPSILRLYNEESITFANSIYFETGVKLKKNQIWGNQNYKVCFGSNRKLFRTPTADACDYSKLVGTSLQVSGNYNSTSYPEGKFYAHIEYYTKDYRGMFTLSNLASSITGSSTSTFKYFAQTSMLFSAWPYIYKFLDDTGNIVYSYSYDVCKYLKGFELFGSNYATSQEYYQMMDKNMTTNIYYIFYESSSKYEYTDGQTYSRYGAPIRRNTYTNYPFAILTRGGLQIFSNFICNGTSNEVPTNVNSHITYIKFGLDKWEYQVWGSSTWYEYFSFSFDDQKQVMRRFHDYISSLKTMTFLNSGEIIMCDHYSGIYYDNGFPITVYKYYSSLLSQNCYYSSSYCYKYRTSSDSYISSGYRICDQLDGRKCYVSQSGYLQMQMGYYWSGTYEGMCYGSTPNLIGGGSGYATVKSYGDLYTDRDMIVHSSSVKTANENLAPWVLLVKADGTPLICSSQSLSCYQGRISQLSASNAGNFQFRNFWNALALLYSNNNNGWWAYQTPRQHHKGASLYSGGFLMNNRGNNDIMYMTRRFISHQYAHCSSGNYYQSYLQRVTSGERRTFMQYYSLDKARFKYDRYDDWHTISIMTFNDNTKWDSYIYNGGWYNYWGADICGRHCETKWFKTTCTCDHGETLAFEQNNNQFWCSHLGDFNVFSKANGDRPWYYE